MMKKEIIATLCLSLVGLAASGQVNRTNYAVPGDGATVPPPSRKGDATYLSPGTIKGEESFLGMNYVTPNALFEETKKVTGTTIVLSPDDKTKYEFKTMVKDNKNKKK